jgi:glycosyltransferase involved in cell wall biosynthesis
VTPTNELTTARYVPAYNRNFFPVDSNLYHCWQSGLLAWLEKWQPDLLVVEANPRYLTNRLAVRWMHDRQRPVIGWGLGAPPISSASLPWKKLATFWRRWERLTLLRSLDAFIAYSHKGAREYWSLGLPFKEVAVALNAVAARPVASQPPSRPPILSNPPIVLFVGRLQARKRVDLLIQACAALPARLQPRLWVVGDGPARVELEGLAGRIYPQSVFRGALHGTALESLFKSADLFVLPGTGGLAVQQAMAHALPVIVAEGDGTQEDLVRPGNGMIVPPGNLSALVEALQTCLSDPPRLRRMGVESYRIVREDVNIEAMVEVFVSTFQNVVS